MRCLWLVVCLSLLFGCRKETRFTLLSADRTGIDFENTITESDSLNVLEFEYIYNGGGVGVGDVNGDGLTDVFFAGNMVSSQLYLNQGDFKFQNITKPAGVTTRSWCTGVSMIDINGDGRLDIYVSTIHPQRNKAVPNLLFINQGNDANGVPRFTEMARQVGLADSSYSVQATFLDYDRDGDLDCYLLTNALEPYNRNNVIGPRNDGTARSVDKLYRNDGGSVPHFTDVSRQAGVIHEGWGLGVIVNDVNRDGWPDVYVANDFQSNDVLYINNRNGTFINRIGDALKHQSHNSMGVDMADINNDGLNDIAVVDMLPDDNLRQKTMFSMINYDRFEMARRLGYQPQYMRNVLQLNRGTRPATTDNPANGAPLFSDIGYLAGVAATDWSWSALLADFDNDGYRDLLITNGYRKDVTNLDFSNYNRDATLFGTEVNQHQKLLEQVEKLEGVYKPKFLYRNNYGGGDRLSFTNVAGEWGLNQPSYANGTAYADLDNDGDLDLVMNNINDKAFVYQNQTVDARNKEESKGQFLRLTLQGNAGNRAGLGAKLKIYYRDGSKPQQQYAEQVLQRGYQTTVEPVVHFGLGGAKRIDSLKIVWLSGKGQKLTGLSANQVVSLNEKNAVEVPTDFLTGDEKNTDSPLFQEVSAAVELTYQHQEDDFVDYKMQQTLLPHKHSQIGPGVAVGDVNGDGLDDVYLSGPARRSGTLFYQRPNGTFQKTNLSPKEAEETGVLLFDADADGDLDLYAVSGSTEFGPDSTKYQHQLYSNDGKGHFNATPTALPPIQTSGSCVVAADFDKDGDLDLFVGGRIVPRQYPRPARSYLLRNDSRRNGAPRFTDVTDQLAPGLSRIGLVTAALWSDVNNDTWPDLVLTGEWMPVTMLSNKNGRLVSGQRLTVPNTATPATGWWNSLTAGDFDNDGDMDFIAGNVGLNSRYKASVAEPVSVYANDYDKNGSLDPIMALYIGGKEYPTHPRETLTDQIPSMKTKFMYFSAYGKSTIEDVLPASMREGGLTCRATYLASAYIENKGGGQWVMRPLPVEAQLAPIYGMVPVDFNNDGNLDLLAVGNNYASEVLTGWYDAGIGLCLRGDGRGNFRAVPLAQSGFLVDKDAKGLAEIRSANGSSLYMATQNGDSLRVFRRSANPREAIVKLRPDDQYALLTLKNGRQRKVEFYWGGTYLSQSTRTFAVPAPTQSVRIVGRQGSRVIKPAAE